jgi:internalin A
MEDSDLSGKTPSIYGIEMATFKLDISSQSLSEIPEHAPVGEIRLLDCSDNRFSSLECLDRCPNLIEFNAAENQLADGLDKIGQLSFLSYLNLSANLFESLAGFPQSEILITLDLSKNHLATVSELPSLPRLRTLVLSNNSISDLQLPSFPALHVLNLSGNSITKLELPDLPSLRILDASHNSIEEIQEFRAEALPFLWSCDLRSNSIGAPGVLKSLSNLPLLYNLSIGENPLANAEGTHLPPILVILPALTILDEKLVNAKDKVKASLTVKKDEVETA